MNIVFEILREHCVYRTTCCITGTLLSDWFYKTRNKREKRKREREEKKTEGWDIKSE